MTGPSYCKNGEGRSHGAQSGSSGRPQERGRPGTSGAGSPADRMPRVHGKALGAVDGGHGGRTLRRQGQLVGRDCVLSPKEVDSERMAKGVWLCKRRRRHGISNRPVHRW